MTARQIIQEFEALPVQEQEEVLLHFKGKESSNSGASVVRYLDRETAKPMIKEILSEHAELFRKLSL
jgi:hypothetical protein